MATLLAGIPRETLKSVGGIMEVYVTELGNISGTTTVTNGVAAFHTNGAAMFKKYVLSKDGGSKFGSVQTGNIANGTNSYENTVTLVFKRNQVSKRNELKVMAANELVAVVNDNDVANISTTGGTVGNLYVIGLQFNNNVGGCDVTSGTMDTGALFGDANSLTILMRALESTPPLGISVADYAKIKAGTTL
jgi:hypothetical protein